jgi:hypothetical protein
MSDDPLPFVKVTLEDAKKALDTSVVPPKVEEKDWRWARKWVPPEPLKAATAAWLLALPAQSRPVDLPQAYPRIANKLCEVWPDPLLCERYFDDLLTDRRGRRMGFPERVLADLKMLRQFYSKGSEAGTVWDVEATRKR